METYEPVPLAKKDPFGVVESLMLLPLLVGGYVSATMLKASTGVATSHFRTGVFVGFAIVAGLVVDLIVCLWLGGYSSGKFWIAWPILSLIIIIPALVAAVLQKLIGAAGTLVTVVVIMLFGNPSSGGANGALYLPSFWRAIGPYLPSRNAFLLLRNTIYFNGNGITLGLVVLPLYFVIAAVIHSLLNWFRSPPPELVTPETEVEAAAMVVPVT